MRKPQGKGLDLAKKHTTDCLAELDSMLDLEDFLRSNSSCRSLDGVRPKTTASGCQPVGFGSPVNFTHVNWTANRKFLALTRRHVAKLLSWKEAVEHFRKLLLDLQLLCSRPVFTDLEGVIRFLVDYRKYQPGWVATAHIKLLLVQDGRLYGRQPIFAVICKAALLPDTAKDHPVQKHEDVEKLGKLLIDLLDALCSVVPVQRHLLGKHFPDWERTRSQLVRYITCEFKDLSRTPTNENLFRSKILKHILRWADEQTFWIAWQFLLLGFNLELYSTSEYCIAYWGIAVVLYNHFLAKLCKISKENDPLKPIDMNRQSWKPITPPDARLLFCYSQLAINLYQMLGIFRKQQKIFLCVGPFNSEKERFIQHFKPLNKIFCWLNYSVFKRDTDHNLPIPAVIECFKNTRRLATELRGSFSDDADKLAELDQIELVAKHNERALYIHYKLSTPDPLLTVSLEFTHHRHFVVATLKSS